MSRLLSKWSFGLLLMAALSGCESIEVIYDSREQLAKEILEIDDYLQANDIQAQVDISGMRFIVTEEGEGTISENEQLEFTATVRMLNGGRFETNVNGTTEEFEFIRYLLVASSIKDHQWQCFHEAAKHIQKNGRITMYVPSVLVLRNRTDVLSGRVNGQNSSIRVPGNTSLIVEAWLHE